MKKTKPSGNKRGINSNLPDSIIANKPNFWYINGKPTLTAINDLDSTQVSNKQSSIRYELNPFWSDERASLTPAKVDSLTGLHRKLGDRRNELERIKKLNSVDAITYANGGQFGDFMQSNAGSIGGVLGAGIGTLIAPGVGTAIGASIGSSIGGTVQGSYDQDQANSDQQSMQAAQQRQAASANYNNRLQTQPMYGANFAVGGVMSTDTINNNKPHWKKQQSYLAERSKTDPRIKNINGTYIIVGDKSLAPQSKTGKFNINDLFLPGETTNSPNDSTILRGQPFPEYLPMSPDTLGTKTQVSLANGGKLPSIKNNSNITVYANGGTHSQNPMGGVPIGNKGLVEQGEVRYKNFIFSNRF